MASVERWNRQHRLQHVLLLVSVTTLILTGFPIKYSHVPAALWAVQLVGSFKNLYTIHVSGAVLLGVTAVYHLGYLILRAARHGIRKEQLAMLPGLKDVRDARDHIKCLLGLSSRMPDFGRYSYLEKFEYVAVVWGLIFMGISGLALWFPEVASRTVPRWGLDTLRVIHSTEAFIAMITLATGHLYAVHLNPSVFPASRVWLDGKINLHHLAAEHPAEYRVLAEEGKVPALPPDQEKERKGLACVAERRWFQLVQIGLYLIIFLYLLSIFVPGLVA